YFFFFYYCKIACNISRIVYTTMVSCELKTSNINMGAESPHCLRPFEHVVCHESSRTFRSNVRESEGAGSVASLPEFGVSPNNSFFLFCAPPQAARRREKKQGTPLQPRQRAGCPLQSRLRG